MKTPQELEAEFKGLKAKHGQVYELTVPLDSEDSQKTCVIYLRKSDRMTASLVRKLAHQDIGKAIEAGLKNLWIGGDSIDNVTSNDDALLGCEGALYEILNKQEASLKKK